MINDQSTYHKLDSARKSKNLLESNHKQVRSSAVGPSTWNSLKTHLLAFADFL